MNTKTHPSLVEPMTVVKRTHVLVEGWRYPRVVETRHLSAFAVPRRNIGTGCIPIGGNRFVTYEYEGRGR